MLNNPRLSVAVSGLLILLTLSGCSQQAPLQPNPTSSLTAIDTTAPPEATATKIVVIATTQAPTQPPTKTPNPTATKTKVPSPTPSATRAALTPTVEIVATGTPIPVVASFDGRWSGTTSQGKPISLEIASNAVIGVSIEFDPAVCGSTSFVDFTPQALNGNSFQKPFKFGATTLMVVSGFIGDGGQMSGEIKAEQNLLCEPVSLTWNAVR